MSHRNFITRLLIISSISLTILRLVLMPTSAQDETSSKVENGKITFINARDGGRVYTMNYDGTDMQPLIDNLDKRGILDAPLDWSPDGFHLVFSILFLKEGDKVGSEIYIVNADGSNLNLLTTEDGASGLPKWSPDSTRIVFQSNDEGISQIHVMDADGAHNQQLTNNTEIGSYCPVWSPDGQHIAYLVGYGTTSRQIYIMEADGSNQRSLTSGVELPNCPVWSPDGSQIAFNATPGNLYIMERDGSNLHSLTDKTSSYRTLNKRARGRGWKRWQNSLRLKLPTNNQARNSHDFHRPSSTV